MFKLREIEREDIPSINRWRSNKELIKFLGAPYRYINTEIDEKWFENYLSNRATNIRCSIINEENDIIGLVSLTNINKINQSALFHIMIGEKELREKGAGYYSINEMLKHAFLDMNLNRIELSVLEYNYRAINIYNKIGFKKEGLKRKAVYKDGEYKNMVVMAILKEEFSSEVDQ